MKKGTLLALALLLILGTQAYGAIQEITQPDAAYLAATTKIDISGLTDLTLYSSITDGTLTVDFSTAVQKRTVGVNWATWSSPPFSESATPDILYTNGETALTMTLDKPVGIFGFEMEPNPFVDVDFIVDFIFMSGPTVVGTITKTVNGSSGARLFAAKALDTVIDQVDILADDPEVDFAIAQVRYSLSLIDIKPGSCPNPLNVKSKGVLPVAIVGTEDFDVTTIDPATVLLEGVAPIRWSIDDVTEPPAEGEPCFSAPVDYVGDGYPDLVLYFKTQDVVAALGTVSDGDEVTLTLTADSFVGIDVVRIIKKK